MNQSTTEQVGNPTGKGGFADNPQNINYGGKRKNEERYDWWMQIFKDMPNKDFLEYRKENPNMPMAALAAYNAVALTPNKLEYLKEVADRTEGKAKQSIEMSGKVTLEEFLSESESPEHTE